MIKPTKILTAALHVIIGQCLVHSFKLAIIFEDIITSESSKVIRSSLKALELQGPSRLLLLWQDDRTLHHCLQSVQGVGPFHGAYLRYSSKEYACSLICIPFQRL